MVDRDLVRRMLADLDLYLSQVSEYRGMILEYAEAFDRLGEAGLPPGVARDAMVRMVGFRNVIVHEDARVDAEIAVGILREHLGDLAGFAARARGWL